MSLGRSLLGVLDCRWDVNSLTSLSTSWWALKQGCVCLLPSCYILQVPIDSHCRHIRILMILELDQRTPVYIAWEKVVSSQSLRHVTSVAKVPVLFLSCYIDEDSIQDFRRSTCLWRMIQLHNNLWYVNQLGHEKIRITLRYMETTAESQDSSNRHMVYISMCVSLMEIVLIPPCACCHKAKTGVLAGPTLRLTNTFSICRMRKG